MLSLEPTIAVARNAERIWYSKDLEWEFSLDTDYLLLSIKRRDEQRARYTIYNRLWMEDGKFFDSLFTNFVFNAQQEIAGWLASDHKTISLYRFPTVTPISINFGDPIDNFQLSENGRFIIAEAKQDESHSIGYTNSTVYVYDVTSSITKKLDSAKAYCLIGNVLYVLYNTYDEPRLVRFNQLDNLQHEHLTLKLPRHSKFICIDPQQKKLACTGKIIALRDVYSAHDLYLYDLETWQYTGKLTGLMAPVKKMDFSADGNRLICIAQSKGLQFIPGLTPASWSESKELLYIFALADLRQSYQILLTGINHELVASSDVNKVITTQANQRLTWQLTPRANQQDRLCYFLTNAQQQLLKLNGVALLKIAHAAVYTVIKPIKDDSILVTKDMLRNLTEGRGWLKLVGRLANAIGSCDIRDLPSDKKLLAGKINVGSIGNSVSISATEIVQFPQMRGDYVTIAERLKKLTDAPQTIPNIEQRAQLAARRFNDEPAGEFEEQFINRKHADLACALLDRIQLKPYPEDRYTPDDQHFLDTLLVLMLGVEGKRNVKPIYH